MQTWAKRGLRTALVTGGLLMLGTGIASADEDVNPDKPASPLDGSITVPVHLDNNVLGTPLGQKALPALHRDVVVSPSDVTGAVPVAKATSATDPAVANTTKTAAPVVTKAQSALVPAPRLVQDLAAPYAAKAEPVTDKITSLPGGDKLPPVSSLDKVNVPAVHEMNRTPAQGNRMNADLVAPVDVSGNAIAVVGKAETTNESVRGYGTDRDVVTDGSHTALGGNVVDLDWALPVQLTNNAVSGGGKASAHGTTAQDAWATGDLDTDGAHGLLGGNVVAPQFATPVQVDGNAVAGGGSAKAGSQTQTAGEAGGSLFTSGKDSAAGGNAVPVPVAVPTRADGNAITAFGKAVTTTESTADATAGATRVGMYRVPTYAETGGDPALAAGNIVQPAVSGPAMLCGNAGGAGGAAHSVCDSASTTGAGGTNRSTGAGSIASGAIADAPVVLPVQGFGNGMAGAGKATTATANTVDSTAGGASYTRGHDSIVSGSTAKAPLTGTADLFANSAAGAGDAASTVRNDAVVHSGGHTGTTGDDSLIGGNMVVAPLVAPAEMYGNAAAGGGAADAAATETKFASSGGGRNTDDDFGVLASNLATVPVASAAQVFGNGTGVLGSTDTRATAVEDFSAGGDSVATGTAGLGSGNIGQAPVSAPFQVFGNGVSGLGRGTQTAANRTTTEAGGDAVSDGAHGAASGNVVSAPVAGAGQAFGDPVAPLGRNHSLAGSMTTTEAGGDTLTSGHDGLLAGNVASPQAMPIVQGFANTVSRTGGVNSAVATNMTEAGSGGDIDTTGDAGVLSGNLLDVPAAAVVQPFDNAAVPGKSRTRGVNHTKGRIGGTSTTRGAKDSLSGIDGTVPAGVNLPIYDVPNEVLAKAMTESANNSDLQAGEKEPQLTLPTGGMAVTELPSFASQRSMPATPAKEFRGAFTGVLTGFAGGMTGLPGRRDLPQSPQLPVPGLLNGVPVSDLLGGLSVAGVPAGVLGQRDLPETPQLPVSGLLGGLPVAGVPAGLPTGVPGRRDLPQPGPVNGLPGGLPVPRALPETPELPVAGLLGGLTVAGVPAQRDLPQTPEPSVSGLPVPGLPAGLPAGLPVPRELPETPRLPVDDLPVPGLVHTPHVSVTGLPVPGLPSGVPAQRDEPQLPVAGLPVPGLSPDSHLPVSALPVSEVPVSSLLSGVSIMGRHVQLPERRDLPRPPALPVSGDVMVPLSAVSQGNVGTLGNLGGFGRSDVFADPSEITTIIPAFAAVDGMTDITTVLPVIPAAPGVSEVAVPGGSSLDSTRAALANLFSTHPIA